MHEPELIERIHALIDGHAAADRFSGAVLVAQGDRPLVTAACGYAIHPSVLPNQLGTRFDIASITKMLTAAAIMQLVGRQAIDLHTPIAAYQVGIPSADTITAHQLLTHTAGFGDYWNDAYRAARSDLRTVSDYLPLFATTPLAFPPGAGHQYSNAGYVVLGALIEAVTGQAYCDHMRQALYQPLSMADTDHYELDMPIANRAIGYTRDSWGGPTDGQLRTNQFIYAVKGSPASNGFSTVSDLHRFLQAFQHQRLIDASLMDLCLTPHVQADQPGVSYGYGFQLIEDGKRGRIMGHAGRAFGADTFAFVYRDLGYTVIVLSNYDRPAGRQLFNGIADLLA